MVDDLISSLENFKTWMEFKGNYSDSDWKRQHTILRRELCKNHHGFRPDELSNIANKADDSEKQKPFWYLFCSAGMLLSI